MIAPVDFPKQQSTPARAGVGVKRTATMPATPRSYEYHEPIMVAEIVERLAAGPGRIIVDGTLGGGGHSAALIAAGARVIGLDQDPEAIAFAGARLSPAGEQFQAIRSNFTEVRHVLESVGVSQIDGALLDIGVSSHQIDTPERGFSFMHDGPLDMRMDPQGPITAADLVNTMSAEQLERIFRSYGEEPAARRIAAALVRQRAVAPFTTTLQLAHAVELVSPRRGKTHPATRVFQALRIAVNRELEVLETALQEFTACLASGGRFAILTFQSLEDRLVKNFFKHRTTEWLDRPEWPEPQRNPDYIFKKITGKAVVASAEEQRANPRSRSAKLRVVAKL